MAAAPLGSRVRGNDVGSRESKVKQSTPFLSRL